MTTVLVVDDWSGWSKSSLSSDLTKTEAEVVVVRTVAEAERFFNGEAGAKVLVVGGVSGAPEFVNSVRSRFRGLTIIGLAEYRELLTDIGCNFFARRDGLSLSVRASLALCYS